MTHYTSFSRYYGTPNPPLTATYAGFVNGEGPTVLGGTLSCVSNTTLASDVGVYLITCGGQTSMNYAITYVNGTLTIIPAPTSTGLISAVTGSGGAASITFTATVASSVTSISPAGTVTFVDTSNNTNLGSATLGSGQASLPPITSLSVGSHLIQATYTPNADFGASMSSVTNPSLTATITAPSSNNDVFAVNTAVNLSASLTGTTTISSPTAVWTMTNTGTNTSSTLACPSTSLCSISSSGITASHSFSSAAVYGFTLTFTDGLGGIVIANTIGGAPTMIVIYDPSAGFVTGGGWIMSQPGAYYADATLTGKATFGFVSKYQKGAAVPTGDTQFTFQTGNLDFHSTVYQWLVTSGGLAQYKGTGTINGTAGYNLLLTARDGNLVGNNAPDGFRIKITDIAGTLVYDNQPGNTDTLSSENTEALGGGSVIVHSGK